MADNFSTFLNTPAAPYRDAVAVVPGDATVIDITNALYVGGAGTIKVTTVDGTDTTLTAVAGAILPLRVNKVFATGTTATLIVALR